MTHERVAIIGTAQSWTKTPWHDKGLHLRSLNDAYRMPGFQRADAWYDLHPLNKFYHPATDKVYAHEIPAGHYCRPKTHLEWMATQTMPLYLHPDYLTQRPEAATWAHAKPFPKADIEGHFGRYFTSSPGWMMGQALMEGVKELHIYGIHLATEIEYIEQRPNFEMLCGALLGRGKRRETVTNGLRHYETADGLLVLPEEAPVLSAGFQYAFETRPGAHEEPLKWELHKIEVKRNRLIDAMKRKPRWTPFITVSEGEDSSESLTFSQAQERLFRYEAMASDTHEALGRIRADAQWGLHG